MLLKLQKSEIEYTFVKNSRAVTNISNIRWFQSEHSFETNVRRTVLLRLTSFLHCVLMYILKNCLQPVLSINPLLYLYKITLLFNHTHNCLSILRGGSRGAGQGGRPP